MKKIILLCCVVGLTGCYKSEWESAKVESEQAKSQVTQLQSELDKAKAEIAKLQETAEYHFQQGQENLKTGRYAEAVESFKTVIARFPNDRLVIPAQKSLKSAQEIFAAETEEKARAEAEAQWAQTRAAEAAERAQADRERLSGTPIDYADFYAKFKSGALVTDKRYRFQALIESGSTLWATSGGKHIVLTHARYDDRAQHEALLKGPERQNRTIVASGADRDWVNIHRVE